MIFVVDHLFFCPWILVQRVPFSVCVCVCGHLSYPLSTPGWATANSVLLLLLVSVARVLTLGSETFRVRSLLQPIHSSLQATAHLTHQQQQWTLLKRNN